MMAKHQTHNITESIEIKEDANRVMAPSLGATDSDALAKHVSDMTGSHLYLHGCSRLSTASDGLTTSLFNDQCVAGFGFS